MLVQSGARPTHAGERHLHVRGDRGGGGPGVEANNIDISVLQNTLTLSGKRENEPANETDVVHRHERYAGDFTRTLEFPYRLDGDKVKATLKNGVLRVHVEKAQEDRPRRIEVQKA